MKKKIGIFLFILSFFMIDATISYAKKKNAEKMEISHDEIRAVYISYLEYFDNFYGGSKSVNQSKINKMLDNIKENGFNTVLLHVSPFSDSIYNSSIFPYSYTLTGVEGKNPGFDYLEYFIQESHSRNILLYAWINPYRISFDKDISKLSDDNPAKKLLGTSNVMISKEGIYYNPASEIVKNLIINGVSEIVNNYNVDGIHFDDYFYIQKDIDKEEYQNFINNNGELSLSEFRLYHTNDLIKRVYKQIKDINTKVKFSIAPDGNINNNYIYHFADVKTWLTSYGYVDIIMPQIYYGFSNQYETFLDSLSKWKKIVTKDNIQIIPVLAFYKSGMEDKEAGKGKNEWIENNDIIKRQVDVIRDNKLKGYALFRYDFMFNNDYINSNISNELKFLKDANFNLNK